MKKLVENVLKINHDKKKIKSLLGDGSYDSNDNFRFLNGKKIDPIVKVKRNSVISSREITRLGIKKSDSKQKISSNGKRKEDIDTDGWLKKLLSHPSKECLVNI